MHKDELKLKYSKFFWYRNYRFRNVLIIWKPWEIWWKMFKIYFFKSSDLQRTWTTESTMCSWWIGANSRRSRVMQPPFTISSPWPGVWLSCWRIYEPLAWTWTSSRAWATAWAHTCVALWPITCRSECTAS